MAPLVVYLASEACAVNGEAFSAGVGRFARVFVGEIPGWTAADPLKITPDDVAEHFEDVRDLDGFSVSGDIYDDVRFIAASLGTSTPDAAG